MEGEQGSKDTKTYEGHGEPNQLPVGGNGVCSVGVIGNVDDVHGLSTCTIEDAEDAAHEEGRTSHQHQGQFHRCIFFATATPHSDEEIHGDKCDFIEHEHGEHVGSDEESEHTHGKEGEPKKVFLGHGFELPRSKGTGEGDDGREEQHGYADSVNTNGVVDVKGWKPLYTAHKEHFAVRIEGSRIEEGEDQIDGECQEGGAPGYHDASNLIETARNPKRRQHQKGD